MSAISKTSMSCIRRGEEQLVRLPEACSMQLETGMMRSCPTTGRM